MSNTKKCTRCGLTFINEEFSTHECLITTWNVQEIGITSWFKAEIDENGDQVFIAQGLNGILYRNVECHHTPPHPDTRPTKYDSELNKYKQNRKYWSDENE